MPHTATLTAVTDGTFAAEVLASPEPVLVKFTADWCPGCKMLSPVLAAIDAEKEAGDLRIVTLDADHNPEVLAAYGVLSLPTLMLFRAGEPVASWVGARPKRRVLQDLAEAGIG